MPHVLLFTLIAAAVFALAYLAQAFLGISLGSRSESSLSPEGFSAGRFLLQTLLGAVIGFVLGLLDHLRDRGKPRSDGE